MKFYLQTWSSGKLDQGLFLINKWIHFFLMQFRSKIFGWLNCSNHLNKIEFVINIFSAFKTSKLSKTQLSTFCREVNFRSTWNTIWYLQEAYFVCLKLREIRGLFKLANLKLIDSHSSSQCLCHYYETGSRAIFLAQQNIYCWST